MIYTFGYAGRSPTALLAVVTRLDAIVCDIRFGPKSGQPGWNRVNLETQFGPRYLWVQALGNRSYHTGSEVSIADPDRGLPVIVDLLTSSSVVLMCGCRSFDTCHRKVVANMLLNLGYQYEELEI